MRTILITGATSGIGFETARILAKQKDSGADTHTDTHTNMIIIASRSEPKVLASVEQIQRESGNPNIVGLTVDLGSLSSVQAFVEQFKQQFSSLDALVCNAGIAGGPTLAHSPEGAELTFATNHLAHFYLTESLLPLLATAAVEKQRPSRIVIVSSGTHDPESRSGLPGPVYDLQQWVHPTAYVPAQAYTNSKLANALYGRELARRLDPRRTTVAIYDPGFIGNTGLLRGLGMLQPVIKFIVETRIALTARWHNVRNQNSSLQRSTPFMARLVVDADLCAQTGIYYVIDFPHHPSRIAQEEDKQDELTKFSNEFLKQHGF